MESRSTDGQNAKRWIVVFVVALIIYLLSFGPAARMMYRRSASEVAARSFEVLYAPVLWLQRMPVIGGCIYLYADLWGAIDD